MIITKKFSCSIVFLLVFSLMEKGSKFILITVPLNPFFRFIRKMIDYTQEKSPYTCVCLCCVYIYIYVCVLQVTLCMIGMKISCAPEELCFCSNNAAQMVFPIIVVIIYLIIFISNRKSNNR